jgi:hypothetical protein
MDAVLADVSGTGAVQDVEALFRRLTEEEDAQHPNDRAVTLQRHLRLWADCMYYAIFFDAPASVLQALIHWGGAPSDNNARYPSALEIAYAKLAATQEPLGAMDHDRLTFHIRHNVHMYDGMIQLFEAEDREALEAHLRAWTSSARAAFITACLAVE